MTWGKQTVAKFVGGEITVKLSGAKSPADYVKDLNGIVKRSEDMSPVFEAYARYLMGVVARNFEAEGRPKRWAALAPSTVQDRIRKGYGPGPILERTGKLKRSLTERGATGNILRIGPKSLKYGSSVKYFVYHQYGTSTMPARKMMVAQRQDNSQLSRIANTYLREGRITYRGPNQ